MSQQPAPRQRVRVTAPRTGLGSHRRRSVSSEIDAQTELGEVYIRSLMRSQLRLALGILLVLGATLGLLPALFSAVPALREVRLVGIPLYWWLLGLVVYPFLVTLGWVYVRHAERNERAFSDLVDRR